MTAPAFRILWASRCCARGCGNSIGPPQTRCPMHISPARFYRIVCSAPVFEASVTWAALRGEFVQARVAA